MRRSWHDHGRAGSESVAPSGRRHRGGRRVSPWPAPASVAPPARSTVLRRVCWSAAASLAARHRVASCRDHLAGRRSPSLLQGAHATGASSGLRRRSASPCGTRRWTARGVRRRCLVAAHIVALVIPALGATSVPAWAADGADADRPQRQPLRREPDRRLRRRGDRRRRCRRARARRDLVATMQHGARGAGVEQRFPVPRAQRVRRDGGGVEARSTRACRSSPRSIESIWRHRAATRDRRRGRRRASDVLGVHVDRPRPRTSTSGAPNCAALDDVRPPFAAAHWCIAGDFNGTAGTRSTPTCSVTALVDAVEDAAAV